MKKGYVFALIFGAMLILITSQSEIVYGQQHKGLSAQNNDVANIVNLAPNPSFEDGVSDADPTIRLVTSPVSGAVGETFTTQVYIDNIPEDPGPQAYEISIDFDPLVLSVTVDDVTFESIWPSGTSIENTELNGNSLTFMSTPFGASPYPSGSNLMVAKIEWTGVGAGTPSLDVNGTILVNDVTQYPDVVEIDGTLTVLDEPSTFDCTTVTGIPQDECVVLAAFYDATGGDDWENKTGWKQTNTPCSWHGVYCSDGYVSELKLYNNKLRGSIPDFNLPNLEYLDLSYNQLSGVIPDFNLPNLKYLDLGNYLIGDVKLSGVIPNFNLPNLESLTLNNNQLSGEIPNFNLPNLEVLDLGNYGEIPIYILTKLEVLDLGNYDREPKGNNHYGGGNKLSGSIPDLANLPNLEGLLGIRQELHFVGNQLSGAIPDFANLPKLKRLYLGNNQLRGNIHDVFPGLTIVFDGNKLSGSIPNFTNLPDLRDLDLRGNQLSGSIPDFDKLPDLQYLDLGNYLPSPYTPSTPCPYMCNQLSGSIPDFANLPNVDNKPLKELYLSANELSGSIPDFANLPVLEWLDLSYNQLTGEIPDFNLPNLKYLNLGSYLEGDDKLSGEIPNFANLPNLETLLLFRNQLSGPLPLGLADNLANLKDFWFHKTALCEPPALQVWLNGITVVVGTSIICPSEFSISIDSVGPEVVLGWHHHRKPDNTNRTNLTTHYAVYRNELPYFEPISDGYRLLPNIDLPTSPDVEVVFSDVAPFADPLTNYFYIVAAIVDPDTDEKVYPGTHTVGVFHFEIIAGSSP